MLWEPQLLISEFPESMRYGSLTERHSGAVKKEDIIALIRDEHGAMPALECREGNAAIRSVLLYMTLCFDEDQMPADCPEPPP